MQCTGFECNRVTEEMAGAEFVKFPSTSYKAHICPPLPIHISSSNNPAGPDLNQNLNLTWPDVFPMPCSSLAPAVLSMSTCSRQFAQFSSFCSYLPFLNCCMCCRPRLLAFLSSISYSSLQPTPGSFIIWFHQSLLTKTSRISVHTSLFFFFQPISPQTASYATVLIAPTAIFFHPILYNL